MFTEKEIVAYRNIKAPNELQQKITKIQKKPNKSLYFISAVAACFIFIISVVITNNQSNIVINGQKLNDTIVFYDTSSYFGRTVSSAISVPVELKTSHNTTVSVSHGLITTENSNPSKNLNISTSSIIWWEIELDENCNEFEMIITNKKGAEKVTLKYDNAKITVTKEKEK